MTIKEIAELAGVSKTTVSFVFNRPERVSDETRRKVLTIAEQVGYKPNPVARSLKTERNLIIGFLLPELTPEGFRNPLLFQILHGLRAGCIAHDLSLHIISPPPEKLMETLQRITVDGLIIYGMVKETKAMAYLETIRIPCISFDGGVPLSIPTIMSQDEEGAYSLMKYILDKGHRKILILSFKDIDPPPGGYSPSAGYRRLSGYKRALAAYHMDAPSQTVTIHPADECSEEGGFRAMTTIYHRLKSPPTVVVAMSDAIAMGVYQFCSDRDIAIPSNLSVAGFDGLYQHAFFRPRLTTVIQPAEEKAVAAVQLLLDEMQKRKSGISRKYDASFFPGESIQEIK